MLKKTYPPKFLAHKRLALGLSLQKFPNSKKIRKQLNKVSTNFYALSTKPRPHTYSLWDSNGVTETTTSSYLSWQSLTNKKFFSRHLGVDQNYDRRPRPEISKLVDLAVREKASKHGRSNVFFMYFAQWFTDGFFRSEYKAPRTTAEVQQVDLAAVYGSNANDSRFLRTHENGKMRLEEFSNGEFLPPLLFEEVNGVVSIKSEFQGLSYSLPPSKDLDDGSGDALIIQQIKSLRGVTYTESLPAEVLLSIHATGLSRGSATLGNLTMTTLFLKEHNKICEKISAEIRATNRGLSQKEYDERIFQAARMINIIMLLKLTISDYIAHISGYDFIEFDTKGNEQQEWYREPRLSAEFNLLYRWHGLVPDHLLVDGEAVDPRITKVLREKSILSVLKSAMNQPCGIVQLGNVPPFLRKQEEKMFQHGRDWKLQPYNEYRKCFGLKPLANFQELTDDTKLAATLEGYYGSIDHLEFTVGIYAEKRRNTSILGRLQAYMVAYDAFTNIYTNPLLAEEHFSASHLTYAGIRWLDEQATLESFVRRHTGVEGLKVSFNPS